MRTLAKVGVLFSVLLLGLTLAGQARAGGVVQGKVIVAETGQPVAGVKIRLEPHKRGRFESASAEVAGAGEVETSDNGSFRVSGVPPGTYFVTANFTPRFPGLLPDWVVVPEDNRVTVKDGETTQSVVVRATEGGVVEAKVVRTAELTPLANAEVWSNDLTARTGPDGVALMRLPAGTNWVFARKGGRLERITKLIEPGKVNHVQFELLPPQKITGTVRDPAGSPAAGVFVSLHPGLHPLAPDYAEAATDQSGRYEITIATEQVDGWWVGIFFRTNAILARDLGRNLVAIQEFADIPTNLDLRLQPGITFSGSVKDTKGAPVTNATVDFRIEEFRPGRQVEPPVTRVDAQGVFTVPAMPQGRPYSVLHCITAKGYSSAHVNLSAGDTKTNHYEFPAFVLERIEP